MHLRGVPIAVIAAWLGHASAAFTLSVYAHSQDDAAAHRPDPRLLPRSAMARSVLSVRTMNQCPSRRWAPPKLRTAYSDSLAEQRHEVARLLSGLHRRGLFGQV